jgi:hypothetical protein
MNASKIDAAKKKKKLESLELKFSSAQESFQAVRSKWESEGITFYGSFEELDKFRLQLLKNIATSYNKAMLNIASAAHTLLEANAALTEAFDVRMELDRYSQTLQERVFDSSKESKEVEQASTAAAGNMKSVHLQR